MTGWRRLAGPARPAQWIVAAADAPAPPLVTDRSMDWPHADGEVRITVKKSAVMAPGVSAAREQTSLWPFMMQFHPPTWPERTTLTLPGSTTVAVRFPVAIRPASVTVKFTEAYELNGGGPISLSETASRAAGGGGGAGLAGASLMTAGGGTEGGVADGTGDGGAAGLDETGRDARAEAVGRSRAAVARPPPEPSVSA